MSQPMDDHRAGDETESSTTTSWPHVVRWLGRPQQVTAAGPVAGLSVLCVVFLGLVLLGEKVTSPAVTLGSYGLLVVLLSTWMLPGRVATGIALLAVAVPLAAMRLGAVDRLTGTFQLTATVIMAVAARLGVIALQRAERARAALSERLLLSERRRADQAAAQLDELLRVNGRLAEFTADAAHELRAPLAIMRTAADRTLDRPRSAAEYRKSLETIRHEVIRLGDMSNALLMLARADEGQLTANKATVDVADFVGDAAARWQVVISEHALVLKLDLPEEGTLNGDAMLLARLIDNLIDNACRYTPRHGWIALSAVRISGRWQMSVTNSGDRINPELQLHIFDRFRRGDPARGRGTGGAGLGLALCRTIVGLHDGAIWLDDSTPEATRFVVELPDTSTDEPAQEPPLPARPSERVVGDPASGPVTDVSREV